jgi:hypothetical protein
MIFLDAFPKSEYMRLQEVIHEANRQDNDAWGRPTPAPAVDVEQLEAEWRRWRDELIEQYRLDGLLSDAPASDPMTFRARVL